MKAEKQKKSKKHKLFEAFPKAIDQSKLLQNAVSLLHEVQKQAEGLKQGNNEEINKLLLKLKDSYQDIGLKVAVVSDEAKKQAKEGISTLMQTWQKNKSQFPDKLTGEVDRLLSKVGLGSKTKTKAATKATKPAVAKRGKAKPAAAVASKPKTAKPTSKVTMASKAAPVKKPRAKAAPATVNTTPAATL